jgi:tRNA A-37 threonylcarbamoyl transferase component Bud32
MRSFLSKEKNTFLKKYLEELFKEKVIIKKLRNFSWSTNYQVITGNNKYFLKNIEGAYNEYTNISKLKEICNKNFRYPQIEHIDADNKILLLKYEDGNILLNELIKKANIATQFIYRQNIEQNIINVALWLAKHHESNFIFYKDEQLLNEYKVESMLDYIKYFFTDFEKKQIYQYLNRTILHSLPISSSNLDFAARNIIINKDKVIVVDWELLYEKNIYYDIIYFITNLECLSRHFIFSQTYFNHLSSLFINSYIKETNLEFNKKHFEYIKFLFYIQYIYFYENKLGFFHLRKNNKRLMYKFINKWIKARICEMINAS